MAYLEMSFILTSLCVISLQVGSGMRTHYRGGVVEYRIVWDDTLDPIDNILNNTNNYREIMRLGRSKSVDIIVFPEFGLTLDTVPEFVTVPDVWENVTPRLDKSQHAALRLLSEAAHENNMYAVVNLKEISDEGGTSRIYNTNVAFDRHGTIVGRYRKYNLFAENSTSPDAPEYSYFDTDFGVRFGMFTCFDILFDEPGLKLVYDYNVTDVAYPTAWFSQLPFLIATQYQASWSYGTGVNLLASGLNIVEQGTTGSGIYAGFAGPLESIHSEKNGCRLIHQLIPIKGREQEEHYDESSESQSCSIRGKLHAFKEILMDIKYISSEDNSCEGNEGNVYVREKNEKQAGGCAFHSDGKVHILKENLKIYTTKLINPEYNNETSMETRTDQKMKIKRYYVNEYVCQGDFCCVFELEFDMTFVAEIEESEVKGDDFQYFRYRMAVLDGVRDFEGEGTGGIQVCGVISCLDENTDTCAVRADSDPTVRRLTVHDEDFGKLSLQKTIFNQISIGGSFQKKRSFVSPNVMIKSDETGQYGSIPGHKSFSFTKVDQGDRISSWLIFNNNNEGNISLITAAIYSRVYDRDGLTPGKFPVTTPPDEGFKWLAIIILLLCIFGRL